MHEETVKWGEIGAVDSVCGEIPLRSVRTGSKLLSGLLINFSEFPMYLIMWTCSHMRVCCLLFETLNVSGISLCPGRICLSLIKLSTAH